ncbi:conserved domain protein [Fibrobacter succinogenes subsp. succinogenes S85]|uniref:Conserved domain protein n=2 Tax=Fibrobacter succinogenes TaxID=833 RepID=C9RLW9_FIBSS|nr:hypothetical protein Fisuc_0519 [Fibrobacter succinogenes subsp. succinogenes S85]ADL25612.1 conserved domain protein [Fibrobacter succinogenes subsp. succinogenes S85]
MEGFKYSLGLEFAKFVAMKSLIRILLVFSLVLMAGCKTKDPVIVTVGDSKLHQSELYTYAPDWDSWGDRERILFLQHWIEEELVYQQAVKAGALKDSVLIRMIERTKRKIVADYFMQTFLDTMIVSDVEKIDFYHKNQNLYLNGKTSVSGAILTFADWKSAVLYYKEFKNTKFESIPPNHRLVKRMREFDGVDMTPDPCMIPSIRRAVVGRITPMKVCDGAAKIAVVTNRLDSADARPLDEVIEDVSMQAWMEHQNVVLKRLKDEWKTGIPIITKINVFSEKEK